MSPYMPTSDDMIFALETLGFEVEDECEKYTIMSDGDYTLRIYHDPDDDQLKKMRTILKDIFSEYEDNIEALVSGEDEYEGSVDVDEFNLEDEDSDYSEEIKKIKGWLSRRLN